MKQLCVCLGLAVAALRAGPIESSIVAAMRLSDQPSYAWVSRIEDDARRYEITGQTMRGDLTLVRMPAVNAVRERLSLDEMDTPIEAIFRGNDRCAFRTETGWRTPEELALRRPGDADLLRPAPMPLGLPDVGLLGPGSSSTPRFSHGRNRPPPRGPYSNLQLGLSRPHEALAVIVSSHSEWLIEGETVRGTLTRLGAQLLLVHDGQPNLTPLAAAGTFKLWIRDGIVTRYQVRLEGVLSVESNGYERDIEVHETSDTILNDIGTAHFEVPMEVRVKLGA